MKFIKCNVDRIIKKCEIANRYIINVFYKDIYKIIILFIISKTVYTFN